MKKIVLLIVTLLIYMSPVNAGWEDNMTGSGVSISANGSCYSKSIDSCYTYCNNGNFAAFSAQLVYYDGARYNVIASAKFGEYKGGLFANTWILNVISNIKHWSPIPNNLNGKSANYGSSLKSAILNNTESLLSAMGVDHDSLINDIKSGKYPKHQKIGSNGVNTTGVRLIIQPLLVYASTGCCEDIGSGKNYAGTAKSIAEFSYNKKANDKYYLWKHRVEENSNLIKLEKSDIGFTAISGKGNWSQWKDPKSGFGIGIFSPFDSVSAGQSSKCDPDKDENGVKTCCDKLNISSKDKSKNTKDNLTRVLSDKEIENECDGKSSSTGDGSGGSSDNNIGGGTDVSGICDPGYTSSSITACCQRLSITKDDRSKNTTQYLTRVLNENELDLFCSNGTVTPGVTPTPVEPPAPVCNYELKDTSVENCGDSSFKDDLDGHFITNKYNTWPCIFKSTDSEYEEVRNHFDDMGSDQNDYCHIYCTETVRYKLPEPDISTYSGRYLVVGESNMYATLAPVYYAVERECRTTDKENSVKGTINYEQFLKDMEENEKKIVEAWDNYRTWQTKQEACNNAPYTGESTHPHCSVYAPLGICEEYEYYTHKNYGEGRASYNGEEQTCSYKVGHCFLKPSYYYQISNAYSTYNSLISKRNEMLGQIEKCNSHVTTAVLDAKLNFEYEEPVYGGETELIETSSNEASTIEYYKGSDATKDKDVTDSYKVYASETKKIEVADCKEDNCTEKKEITYKSNAWIKSNYKIEKNYGLPENMYLYVNKYSGQSFNSKAEAGDNCLTMDRSNLPIHFSTKPGDYDFKIETSTFGDGNRLEDYAFNDASFADKTYEYKKTYNCKYNVSCEKMVIKTDEDCEHFKNECPTEYNKFGCGSGFMFRPISLNSKEEAFPGRDGGGRTPGGKWNNDSTISSVITNGRGVSTYEIYKENPMYEITLTPKLMREIRDYNKDMNSEYVTIYDEELPSVGVAGYTSLNNIECKHNGGHCISDKIRDWGVRGCALKNLNHGYTKCSNVEAW